MKGSLDMAILIETEKLGRYFGDIKAVDGVSFNVKKGDVLGFLGPNGAGKSTTMKMITGFLTPSFGLARVNGFDVAENPIQVKKSIGYLPENAPLYGEMTVAAFLKFICEVRGMEKALHKRAIDRVIDLTNIKEVLYQPIETLSKGFKRRVGLAQALIHDPEILVLDEPTDGLDPNQKHEVRQLINKMSKDKCIVLSTHILEEVDEVCNRVIIIAHGKVVADESADELRRRSKLFGALTISFENVSEQEALQVLQKTPQIKRVEKFLSHTNHPYFTLYPQNSHKENLVAIIMKETKDRNWSVRDFRIESGQLDQVFRDLTTK